MLVSMAGLTMREPGQIIEVDEDEGKRLIEAGFAAPEKKLFETVTVKLPENTSLLPANHPNQTTRATRNRSVRR